MRVPDAIKNCVVFVGLEKNGKYTFGGTAFLVGVELKPGFGCHTYLVTASHCADKLEGRPFVIRANRKDGTSEILHGAGVRWYRHPTEKLDIAITPWRPPDELDIGWIHDVDFITPEGFRDHKVGIGDEVYTCGLFTKLHGRTRNSPVIRTGNLAMLPEDKIPTKDFGPMEAYLIEARSLGGISGSPVFVRQTVRLGDVSGCGKTFLLGLMHGHWEIDPTEINEYNPSPSPGVNLGVAIVVPAVKIKEVLHAPEQIQMRTQVQEELEAEEALRNAPQMDSDIKMPSPKRTSRTL